MTTTRYFRGPVALFLGAAVMTAGLVVAPAEATGDANGPACSDIIDGGGDWYEGTLNFYFSLAAPACKKVTYTLYAVTEGGDGTVYSTSSYTVDPSTGSLYFSLAVPDPDSATLCTIVDVYGTTTVKAKKRHEHEHGGDDARQKRRVRTVIADRAPDAGYAQFFDDAYTCGSPSRDFH